MDFEKLQTVIPKDPIKWSTEDVGKWLQFIGLNQYVQSFKAETIDGACLCNITDEDLQQCLGVQSNIIRKKILNWLNIGIKEYSIYLKNQMDQNNGFNKEATNYCQFLQQKQITYSDMPFNVFNNQCLEYDMLNSQTQQNQFGNTNNNFGQNIQSYQLQQQQQYNKIIFDQNSEETKCKPVNSNILQENTQLSNLQNQSQQQQQGKNQFQLPQNSKSKYLTAQQQADSQQNIHKIQRKVTVHSSNHNNNQDQNKQPLNNVNQNQNHLQQYQNLFKKPVSQQQQQQINKNSDQMEEETIKDNVQNTNKQQIDNINQQNQIIQNDNEEQKQDQMQLEDQKSTNVNQPIAQDNINENIQLNIKPFDGPQRIFYCIDDKGGKIGRHSSNQILILEESISRYHAEISFVDNQFKLKDIGSTTGTYIKIQDKLEITKGMVLEMGSNQFLTEQMIVNSPNQGELWLKIIDGTNINDKERYILKFDTNQKTNYLGRKSTNQMAFTEDQHLSNQHCKFYLQNETFYIEDQASTNGSWLRLSNEGVASELFTITDKSVFKIGTTSTYECEIKTEKVVENSDNIMCIICCETERNCLNLPCQHTCACFKCSKNLKVCPICRVKIEDIIQIYNA